MPEGVTKFTLIDGQQRLTTLLVLLAVLRDSARHLPGNLASKIDDLLLKNRHQDDADVYKLLPTQVDRPAFCAIMDGSAPPADGQIGRAFEYFARKVRLAGQTHLEKLHTVISKSLVLVSIVLDKEDNPYLIFESLNAKGRPLTQADLIRNYFFMRINVQVQAKLYEGHWRPMQERLGEDLTDYIRHFLMRDGKNFKLADVYYTLKESVEGMTDSEVIDYLKQVAAFSGYYSKLLDPASEKSEKIAERMARLNRFEATTAYPFLLNVYHDYEEGRLAKDDFAAILDVLETFLIRRFICNVPTHGLNRLFASLYGHARAAESLVEGVKQGLRDKSFGSDKEFREKFVEGKLYGSGERREKAKLILERLERSFAHKEAIDPTALTIEHVMPQTPTEWWKQQLGEDWEATYETWLNTVGNLTLTGYNPELSNSDYPKKKAILARSHIELNRHFQEVETWDEGAIARRGEILADRALMIWPDFAGREDDERLVAADSELEQEDVRLLMAGVVERFGGEVERLGSGPRYIARVGDGKVINIKYSKRHSDYYWFGLHHSLWEDMGKCGVTHVVFILLPHGYVTVPVSLVKEYIADAGFSPRSDGSIRHYHVMISQEPKLEFFHHGKPWRVSLKPFYVKFEPSLDQ